MMEEENNRFNRRGWKIIRLMINRNNDIKWMNLRNRNSFLSFIVAENCTVPLYTYV